MTPDDASATTATQVERRSRVHIITLNFGEHHDATLYRIEAGDYVRFKPGYSLLGRKVLLYTNHIENETEEFVRSQYRCLEWSRDDKDCTAPCSCSLITDTSLRCEVRCARPGTFHYYFVCDGGTDDKEAPSGSGWWSTPPRLAGGMRPDELCCLTVLAKCLGPLRRWERTLREAYEAGYNAIHFTPVQTLGASGSGYSIADQLKPDPRLGAEVTFADLEEVLTKMRNEWKMVSFCDVVLNHTANESLWLNDVPEATYNCMSCPYLRPAALIDAALLRVDFDVANQLQLDELRRVLWNDVLPPLRLHELFSCSVPDLVRRFTALAKERVPAPNEKRHTDQVELKLIQDQHYRRNMCTVDMEVALSLYNVHVGDCDEESRVRRCADCFRDHLERLNDAAKDQIRDHFNSVVENAISHVRYERVSPDGPKVPVSRRPLVTPYFTWPSEARDAESAELIVFGSAGAKVQAHNGWVMGADPLHDFASDGRVYMRRELIAWGDSVKLRFGASPEDCPALWSRMKDYVELTAELFDGIRLDNCHSTPLHVAEYLVDCARNVKPHLYVVAELFTDSDDVDNVFVNRLGISSLIREAMSAHEATELGRLVYRFGGRPVGAFLQEKVAKAAPQVAHAMFLDVTHDNVSPVEARGVWDVVPSAALVSMAHCAVGSTRGLDELAPKQLHVVEESRLYPAWGDMSETSEPRVSADSGVISARRALNRLHQNMAREGYNEVFVDQVDDALVVVTRHNPRTRESVVMLSCTSFGPPPMQDGMPAVRHPPRPLVVQGHVHRVLVDASVVRKAGVPEQFEDHPRYVCGLKAWGAAVRLDYPVDLCDVFSRIDVEQEGARTTLQWGVLRPGRAVALHVKPEPRAAQAFSQIHRALVAPIPEFDSLDLEQLNILLYRCENEERDASGGKTGVYTVPGHGPLVYAGLRGVVSLFEEIASRDDLGHPLCANVRDGDWLCEYTWRRLEQEVPSASEAVKALLRPLSVLPRFLQPAYVFAALSRLCRVAESVASRRLSPGDGSGAWRSLSLTSVQLVSRVASARLPIVPSQPTLAAGLPHFATGYMRCWGRDTFIALRGMLLLTGRLKEARAHILGFGACLRHGLIPNLLDNGVNARYNARDAVWWWLLSVQQYCDHAGDYNILSESVGRLYPSDDASAPSMAEDGVPHTVVRQPLHDVIQEALDTHFQGLIFRERNAGPRIDAHMTDKGFTLQIGIDPETGFPFGGNEANCGTWMDKMGSSQEAGNKGVPATPRDGSAVELVALAYSTARWLHRAHAARAYPHAGLVRKCTVDCTSWTWRQWADKIQNAFERHFWVPTEPCAADARPDLVNRRGIYKDVHGATQPFTEYQLRCNYAVALAVAPDMFEPKHARIALDTAIRILAGPLGMKTLDPSDWAYRGDYDGGDHSHGHNYHQGPEWGWPLGFLQLARLRWARPEETSAVRASVRRALAPVLAELHSSPWRGLPELTNKDGAYCPHSCRSQAWSNALFLEVLHELRVNERARLLSAD